MTFWMRPHLFVWDFHSCPIELLEPLYPTYGAVHVHLIDHGQVPKAYIDRLKARGFIVLGVLGDYDREGHPWGFWARPWEEFCAENARIGPIGLSANFEDAWEALDVDTGGESSLTLLTAFRNRWPKKNLCLNTYDECGGINLAIWAEMNARLYLQTYKGGVQPPQMIEISTLRSWAVKYGWPKRKLGFIKPCLATYANADGVRVPGEAQIGSMKDAGTIGFQAYYADGSDLGEPEKYLAPLGRSAIAVGAAK